MAWEGILREREGEEGLIKRTRRLVTGTWSFKIRGEEGEDGLRALVWTSGVVGNNSSKSKGRSHETRSSRGRQSGDAGSSLKAFADGMDFEADASQVVVIQVSATVEQKSRFLKRLGGKKRK